MKKITFSIAISILILSLMISCTQRIVGVWNVEKYEFVTPGKQTVILNNIGSINFYKNGTGSKKLDYSILETSKKDYQPFKWNIVEKKYINIEGDESDMSKSWIIIENSKKVQRWKSTDGNNSIQEIVLKK